MRTKQNLANIPEIKKLLMHTPSTVDFRPLVACVMRECGCTFQEIADVMGFSRQMAETMVNKGKQ